jgi:uncharacterized protein (TIGR00297 family)
VSPLSAVALAAVFAAAGWRAGALTASGALAATAVGAGVLGGAGWAGAAVLAAFFISSSLISRIGVGIPAVGDAKGNRRDHWQVLANGGPAALGALAAQDQPSLALWIATASLAGAAADTWATSVGAWSRTAPRHLLSRQPVPRGTSGGVTALGSLGALGGALIVAAAGVLAGHDARLWAATAIGFGGMVVDSALGAAAQGRFRCPVCVEPSEWRVHRCGTATIVEGGWRWLDNDGVNAIAAALAGLAGWVCWAWLSAPSG